jgi:hypothetical protein
MRKVLFLTIVFTLIYSKAQAGSPLSLFSYPYKGHFTFQAPRRDPWYYVEHNGSPDKWEHFMYNCASAAILKKRIGTTKTILVMCSLDLIKEYCDGYREGFSTRDMSMNVLGMLSGLLNKKLLCEYDITQQKITLQYSFHCSL